MNWLWVYLCVAFGHFINGMAVRCQLKSLGMIITIGGGRVIKVIARSLLWPARFVYLCWLLGKWLIEFARTLYDLAQCRMED